MGEENEGSTKCICLFSLLPSSEMAFARLLFWGFQGVFPPLLVQGLLDSQLAPEEVKSKVMFSHISKYNSLPACKSLGLKHQQPHLSTYILKPARQVRKSSLNGTCELAHSVS